MKNPSDLKEFLKTIVTWVYFIVTLFFYHQNYIKADLNFLSLSSQFYH